MQNLESTISEMPGVGPFYSKKFHKLGITTLESLFYHVPHRYVDYSKIEVIKNLRAGEIVTIHAKVNSITNIFSKRGVRMQIGSVEDSTGKLTVVWFNQPYLIKTLYPGRLTSLSGKVGFFNRKLCLSSPDFEILSSEDSETTHTGRLLPIYPETEGLSSKLIRTKIREAFTNTLIEEYLPDRQLRQSHLAPVREAIRMVHFPKSLKETEDGKRRLAFNELLFMHLKSLYRKSEWKKNRPTYKLKIDRTLINQFIKVLPFKLTASQLKAIDEVMDDMSGTYPMNRLLEGDVGSGKTVVAAAGAFAAFLNGYQTLIMAPTQILAEQHFVTLLALFKPFNVRISLITASVKKIELGRSDIVIGTHTLIHKKHTFEKVALVVIDEQHKFGVEQRTHLVKKTGKKSIVPHVLTMTATPIPRTIALTSYGDLDLSVLTESPAGRQKITTWVVPETKRQGAHSWIEAKVVKDKSQIFWICPLIDESEKETMEGIKAVTKEFTELKKIFPKLKLGLLHGRLKTAEKNEILHDFRKGNVDILVSTPVVEVGIDIPNAGVMVIEAAERFGLAALHQLRGRVGRGRKKSYCLLFSNIKSGGAFKRLKAMEKMHSGFELAELDLKLRGPGEIFGTLQSGFSELKVASWGNFELIKETKETAEDAIRNPQKYELLTSKLETQLHVA